MEHPAVAGLTGAANGAALLRMGTALSALTATPASGTPMCPWFGQTSSTQSSAKAKLGAQDFKKAMNEVAEWFDELPDAAKRYWTGSLTLDPDSLPWFAFRQYRDLECRFYFTYEQMLKHQPRMTFEEYQRTKDFEIWVFRERMKLHAMEQETVMQREEEVVSGWARSPAFVVDGEHEQ